MSLFSIPDELLPNETMLDDMMKQTRALMPAEFASTVNLMAHPLAGAAAMSALGVGFASQAVGVWFGTMTAATAASQRLFLPMFEEFPDAGSFREVARTPHVRAEAAKPRARKAATETAIEAQPEEPPEATEIGEAKETAPDTASIEPPVEVLMRAQAEQSALDFDGTSPAEPVQAATADAVAEPIPVSSNAVVEPVAKAAPVAVDTAAAPEAAAAEVVLSIVAAESTAPATAIQTTAVAQEDFRKPTAIDKPEMADDLKAISGVGPKLEQVLNGLGVWTFAQIAGWSREEIAWIDDTLGFKGRIDRDGWIGQAAKLAGTRAEAGE